MLKQLIDVAQEAGLRILSIYKQSSYQITNKEDDSPLTEADFVSHHFICEALSNLYPAIPILSEESTQQYSYDIRKQWEYFFLVDPLDGTKEFIKRNGEFTINIALVRKNKPILGVIHAPVIGVTYYAEEYKGAYKIFNDTITALSTQSISSNTLRVVTSRSHLSSRTQTCLDALAKQGKDIEITAIGSALKFGWIAEGRADIYPRLAPTMEWDTAAGQVIVNEVGKKVRVFDSAKQLEYNKEALVNPDFIVE